MEIESPLLQQYYLVKLQLLNISSKFFIILLFFRNEILRGKFIQYFRFVFCTRIAIYIFIFQTNFFPFLVCCIVIRKQIALKARRSHPQGAQFVGGVDNRDKILHDAFFFQRKDPSGQSIIFVANIHRVPFWRGREGRGEGSRIVEFPSFAVSVHCESRAN